MFFPYTVSYLACVFAVATSPPVLGLAHGENGDAQISDPASEQLEASWDGPESELEMNAGAAAACSHYPNNPKPKRAIFFFLGGTGVPPSAGGPDGVVTKLKWGERKRGKYQLRSWLENKIM